MTFPQFAYRNVMRNKRTYAAYFLSSSFSVMIFFVYALFIFHPAIKKGVTASLAVSMMTAAEYIMYIFSFFFVLYSVSTFLKTRKREFGILMMHGMTRGQLNKLVFLENMLIGIAAICTGIAAGLLTGKLFLMIGASILDVKQLHFYLSWKPLGLTISAFLLLFLFISMFTTSLVRTNKLIDLFQSGQKPKKEPKVSVLLSTLSAVLLIVSYYLAATATMGNLNYRMLPVIGMTIVGTYFFYTQLSVFILKVLQKNKLLFWKRTNLITISNLTYRLKDNARMFFMVTIVSAVAFCAVGALASVHALNKQIKMNFPAAISYVAKNHQPFQTQNLKEIVDDIEKKNLKYTKLSIPIKMVKIFKEPKGVSPDALPVISFSSYKRLVGKAGLDIHEPHLTGEKILGMNTNNTSRKVTYTLKQNRMNLKQNQLAKQVVIPGEAIGYQGIIVSDDLYKSLSADAGIFQYTGFFISDPEKSEGVDDHLVNSGSMPSYAKAPYAMVVSGDILKMQKGLFSTMLFVALLIGTVFFIAAGSFLYFRLYADLDYDRRQYLTITKVGLTEKELNRIVTQQLLLLFFIPIIVAFIHSAFAFKALQSFYSASIFSNMLLVLGCFLAAQVLYFFFIRYHYLMNLKRSLI